MVALGYDDGTVVIKIGSENPCISMDHAGKIVWAQQMEVQQANLQRLSEEIEDGERLSLVVKDLGRTELYPHALQHNSNGRFVAVVGDGDYVIYTALAWRQKSFGTGLNFVWAQDPKEYAVRESASRVKVFRSFK
jgi:coatomer subunit beta'